jgi:hypothetical protein
MTLRIVPTMPALLWLSSSLAHAQSRTTMDLESLEVVPSVLVVVEGVTAAAEADGLSADALLQDVQAMLAEADIAVLSEQEWSDLIGNPALQLDLQLLKPSPHLYLFAVSLELRQLTILVRDSTKMAWTRTWSAGTLLGTTPTANLPTLRREVRTLVQRFVTAYHEAVARRGEPFEAPRRRRVAAE